MIEDAILTELGVIKEHLATIEQAIKGLPELCQMHAKAIAVLQNEADWALPEHEAFDKRLGKLEGWRSWAIGAWAGVSFISGIVMAVGIPFILKNIHI